MGIKSGLKYHNINGPSLVYKDNKWAEFAGRSISLQIEKSNLSLFIAYFTFYYHPSNTLRYFTEQNESSGNDQQELKLK